MRLVPSTHGYWNVTSFDGEHTLSDGSAIKYRWTSRNNRKGRHQLLLPKESPVVGLHRTSSGHGIAANIRRMLTWFPFWDISYLIAIVYTLGSIIWVINASITGWPSVCSSLRLSACLEYHQASRGKSMTWCPKCCAALLRACQCMLLSAIREVLL